MSLTIPTTHTRPDTRTTGVWRGGAIRATQVAALAANAIHAYALGARRTALSLRAIDVVGQATYTTVAKVPFAFAAGREAVGLQIVVQLDNADVRITLRNATDTVDLATWTDASTGTGTVKASVGPSASADVLVKIEAREHSGAGGTIPLVHLYERGHTQYTYPNAVLDHVAIAQSYAWDHVWSFDAAGTSTEDVGGVGGSTLTRTANVTNYAPIYDGTRGYDRITVHAASTGDYSGNINVSRTSDCFFEAIFTLPEAQTAAGVYTLAAVGQGTAASGFCLIRYYATADVVRVYNAPGSSLIAALTGLNAATLAAGPVYIAVWWDHAALTYRVYWNAGAGETALSAAGGAGSGSTARPIGLGYSTADSSAKMGVHYAAFSRGEPDATYRSLQYAARGW